MTASTSKVQEIRELLEKATPGPCRIQVMGPQKADLIAGGTFMGLNGGSGAPDKYEPDDAARWEADAALIAALRNNAEWLLSQADRVRVLEEALVEMVNEFEGSTYDMNDGTQSPRRRNLCERARGALSTKGDGR